MFLFNDTNCSLILTCPSLRKLSKQAKHVSKSYIDCIDPGESWTSVQTLLSDLHALRIVEFFAHYSRKFKIIICLTLLSVQLGMSVD